MKLLITHSKAKYDDALTLLEEAVAMNPKSLLIDYGLGQLFIHKGETEKAMQHLEKVVAKEPENYETIKVGYSLLIPNVYSNQV